MRQPQGDKRRLTVNGVECEWQRVSDPDEIDLCGVLTYPDILDEDTEKELIDAWRALLNEEGTDL